MKPMVMIRVRLRRAPDCCGSDACPARSLGLVVRRVAGSLQVGAAVEGDRDSPLERWNWTCLQEGRTHDRVLVGDRLISANGQMGARGMLRELGAHGSSDTVELVLRRDLVLRAGHQVCEISAVKAEDDGFA